MSDYLEQIMQLRDALDQACRSGHYAGLSLERLKDARDATGDLLDRVSYIIENIAPLSPPQVDAKAMRHVGDLWAELPSGRIREKHFDRLVTTSPTLSALHRQGIDLSGAYKYSEDEVEVSRLLGDELRGCPQYVPKFTLDGKNFMVSPAHLGSVRKVLLSLQDKKVISWFDLREQTKDGKRLPLKRAKMRTEDGRCLVLVKGLKGEFRSLLEGHWLTAYAYQVALDQLRRNDTTFEIYTRVEYRLPGDISGDASDFDLLVRAGRTFVFVECKSGNLVEGWGRNRLAQIPRKVDAVETVFNGVGTDAVDRHYFLLLAPREDRDVGRVKELLAKASREVSVVQPAEVRALLQKYLT